MHSWHQLLRTHARRPYLFPTRGLGQSDPRQLFGRTLFMLRFEGHLDSQEV